MAPLTLGSSPLARGLHARRQSHTLRSRIIPARAGFTFSLIFSSPWLRDHPRSRGVYSHTNTHDIISAGSSPLARGLHAAVPGRYDTAGIIPARAGFTQYGPRGRTEPQDHPRSRGVYLTEIGVPTQSVGSSPLARGLPNREYGMKRSRRIIPARAGFTTMTAWTMVISRDHPRSRGVYVARRVLSADRAGSSPLARGLLDPETETEACMRIIPARAGFTHLESPSESLLWDHPRSRGVYGVCQGPPMWRWGSSPLARGLRIQRINIINRPRIIPARAGFTAAVRRKLLRECGSSPLARGLLPDNYFIRPRRGIIPARAGFTAPTGPRPRARLDHPRSRGVYAPALHACTP